jgi:4-hydroxy-tetrahydrodipicolinate synthase
VPVRDSPGVVSAIVGWDALALAALSEGAAGVMCGTGNALAAELVAVYRAVADNDLRTARAEWERIYPLVDTIMSTNFVPAVKAAANARGLQVGDPREPLLPLRGEAAARIEALAAQLPPVTSAV